MKKLLITTMAAVSVGLCAKADDTGFISGTSFETVPEKSYLATNGVTTLCKWYDEAGSVLSDNDSDDLELGRRYWMTEATDAQLVVSNVTNFAGDDNRPQEWSGDENHWALYIDTDKPLMRYVNHSVNDQKASGIDLNQDIFFDSVVQFTATDVAADSDSADKLRIWLYSSPENLDGAVFGEKEAITNLVVTAGYYKPNDNTTYKTNYLTNVPISPDSWHRLTIKTFVEEGYTKFNIYVDGEIVKVGDLQDFDCLYKVDGQDTLQCVAFDGKGAVDDIVFTTTDPFYKPPVEVEKVKTTVSFNDWSAVMTVMVDGGQQLAGEVEYNWEKDSSHTIMFMLNAGYEFVSSSPEATVDNGVYTITVAPNADMTVSIVTKVVESGDSAWKDNENFATDLTTNVAGLLANVYNKVTGEPTDEQAAYLMTTVGTASGVVTVKVGGETKAAADKFELSVGNNVKIQVPYYEVTDGVVKVATAIIALETVEITVGDESKTISPAITGVLSVTGITSEENVVGELSNNVATVKVRDTTDPIKLAFDGVVPTDVFFTKKVYTKADASTTVAYGMTGLDDSAFWFYFQYGQNLDDLRSVWNGGSVNYKIGCYNKGIANVVMNITIDQQFTVKFKNGENVVQSTDVWNGEYVTAPSSDPEAPTGQQFVGWFNGDAKFDETVPVTANVNYTAKFEDTATYPSVGGVETPVYSENAKKAIVAAFPGNSYPADGLTVKVNGETLTGDSAVAMLNEAVEMFTLAADAKFFDEDGVMDISFKATNPLMETETAEATDYEAKVGKATATVNGTYEVVPKYIDIATNTELTAKPEGTVTFRLVIQKK